MKKIIIANWKMNPATLTEAKELFDKVAKGVENFKDVEIVICPPFVYIPAFQHLNISTIKLGSQDCFWEQEGAHTGEVSPKMLKDLGCEYVIVGHSEKRILGETNENISKKVQLVLREKMIPILCIDKISQLDSIWQKGTIVVFEPLFAIGTGNPCDSDKAKKMLMEIKNKIGERESVLYGGSVDSENAMSYIKEAGFDGLLVGGASLISEEFIKIVKNI